MTKAKKLIEVAMPIKEISAESVRDKSHTSRTHFYFTFMVGTTSASCMQGCHFCQSGAGSIGRAMPAGFQRCYTGIIR